MTSKIEDLEKLIGKSCDLLDPATGKIGVYEVYIVGCFIVSGFYGTRIILKGRAGNQKGYICYINSLKFHNVEHNTRPLDQITNIRDVRSIKGPIHPELLEMVQTWKIQFKNKKEHLENYWGISQKENKL